MYYRDFIKTLNEKNEYKLSRGYRRLSPRMKSAVDEIYSKLETDNSFISNLDNEVKEIAKKHRVREAELSDYLENEAEHLFGDL